MIEWFQDNKWRIVIPVEPCASSSETTSRM